ncbi:MAG: hypothetical protein ABI172_01890 [Ginsengibacter sp.]
MKKIFLIVLIAGFFITTNITADAQCSICSKTVMQMGDKPAHGFNTGIIYLMLVPYVAVGIIGYKWFTSNHEKE